MAFFLPTVATGNGLTLVTLGRTGEIMGFFYPRIDFAQNIREAMPAVRLVDSGQFLWTFQEFWQCSQSMEPGGNVVVTRLAHRELDLQLELRDVVPPGEQALFRQVRITKGPNVGRVQFIHYFRLVAGDVLERNAVQSYPNENLVVQHFRNIALSLGATAPFAAQCSNYALNAESATKQAIQSGHFGSSHQSIGRVDFAVGFEPVQASDWRVTLVLSGAASVSAAMTNAKRLVALPFADVIAAAEARTDGILHDAGPCTAPELSEVYDRAVIALHDLYDLSEGTFIAAPEFDPGYEWSGGYGYCWPRDAVVCALAMQRIGRTDLARRFFEWARRTQLADGHWYQRYWSEGTFAPSWCVRAGEIQLDQTCAMVHSAGLFARRLGHESEGFCERMRPMVERAVLAIDLMVSDLGLHRTSCDLWENSTGSFAYTQAAVIAAFREADEVFRIDAARTGPTVRARLRERLIGTFWNPERRRWLRRITPEGEQDATRDSSAMGLIDPWEVLDLSDPADCIMARETLDGISSDLRAPVRGGSAILRFEGEAYMGGGPGCVNTLWLAVCRLRLAAATSDPRERAEQRALAMAELKVAIANTNPAGQLPELIPKVSFDYWAAPHAWASSLFIEAVHALSSLEPADTTAFGSERARVRRRAPSR